MVVSGGCDRVLLMVAIAYYCCCLVGTYLGSAADGYDRLLLIVAPLLLIVVTGCCWWLWTYVECWLLQVARIQLMVLDALKKIQAPQVDQLQRAISKLNSELMDITTVSDQLVTNSLSFIIQND